MKKFLILAHASMDAIEDMQKDNTGNPEGEMKLWLKWKEKNEANVIDLGTPLFGGLKVLADGKTILSTKDVQGYMMMQAKDMEEALILIKKSPLFPFMDGFSVEIHEMIDMQ